jgi:hypothetical protein
MAIGYRGCTTSFECSPLRCWPASSIEYQRRSAARTEKVGFITAAMIVMGSPSVPRSRGPSLHRYPLPLDLATGRLQYGRSHFPAVGGSRGSASTGPIPDPRRSAGSVGSIAVEVTKEPLSVSNQRVCDGCGVRLCIRVTQRVPPCPLAVHPGEEARLGRSGIRSSAAHAEGWSTTIATTIGRSLRAGEAGGRPVAQAKTPATRPRPVAEVTAGAR